MIAGSAGQRAKPVGIWSLSLRCRILKYIRTMHDLGAQLKNLARTEQQRRRKQAILQMRSQKTCNAAKISAVIIKQRRNAQLTSACKYIARPKNILYSIGTKGPFWRKEILLGGKCRSADLLPSPICQKKDTLCPNIQCVFSIAKKHFNTCPETMPST